MLDPQHPADRHHLRQHRVVIKTHLERREAARDVPGWVWLRHGALPSDGGARPVRVLAVVDDHVVETLEVVSLVHGQRVGKRVVVLVQGALDICCEVSAKMINLQRFVVL